MTSTTRSRAERERVRRDRDRRWQIIVVCVALGFATIAAFANSPRGLLGAEDQVETDDVPSVIREQMRTTLTVQTSDAGVVRFAMLSGIDPKSAAATVVFIPAATVIEIPALGLQPLTNLLQSSDATALATNLANALGVRIDHTAVLSEADLAKVFAIAPRIAVAVPEAVTVDDGVATLQPGENQIASSIAAQLVSGQDSRGALAHFATVQAVLEGWFGALRAEPDLIAAGAEVTGAAGLLRLSGFSEGLQFNTLPVASVAAGDVERYEVDESEANGLFDERFASARLGIRGQRVRLELLNGVGTPGLVQLVANRVVPAGGNVILTGNSVRFGETTTKVVYYRDIDAQAARALVELLGEGAVAKDASPVSVVDITIVIGADLADKLKR